MNEPIPKKRLWWRKRPAPNPYPDTLGQEIGYKLDSRYSGCFLAAAAIGLLLVCGVAFLAYWLTH